MKRHLRYLVILAVCASPAAARADDDEDATVVEARKEFTEGTRLVRAERWAEALAAFERAAAVKQHAITTFNIGQCERAMGQYTRARRSFLSALAQDEASGKSALTDTTREEAKGLLAELDKILARVTVTLEPPDAALAVDGRPLERSEGDVFVGGTLPPGPGAPPNVVTFQAVLNPGAHVFTVSRQGYQDIVVNRSLSAGAVSAVDLRLDRLPATIHVTSNLADALVRINDADVGNPPVSVSRAAGRYHVVTTRKGFLTVESDVTVRPGERLDLVATMREEKPALTQRWWFWTGIVVVVGGAAVATYALTRSDPAPTRPATDGGGLGWSLKVN